MNYCVNELYAYCACVNVCMCACVYVRVCGDGVYSRVFSCARVCTYLCDSVHAGHPDVTHLQLVIRSSIIIT